LTLFVAPKTPAKLVTFWQSAFRAESGSAPVGSRHTEIDLPALPNSFGPESAAALRGVPLGRLACLPLIGHGGGRRVGKALELYHSAVAPYAHAAIARGAIDPMADILFRRHRELLRRRAEIAVVKGLRCRERQRAEKSNDKAKSAKIHAPYCSQPIAATVSPWPGGSARGRDMKPIFA